MPGFLGGSSSGGTGGEIRFPAELIDPVTKLRVSQPQTMMDTDFEYGLQPTKWETVELINNTPSFFSASGDTTIPNLLDLTTTSDSREIKVTTSLPHGLAVGIPLNISGSKSLTADGAYIINSVPDSTTFTYLCKQNQLTTASIIDLYTSVITGQFFQGSQIKIADSDGIVTNASAVSTLTVKTDSPHGFGVNTPFYFLNLNSTVSQEFDASNTGAKSFDSSNTATAQSFDGSNTLTSYPIDLSNKSHSNTASFVSNIVATNITNDTITVTHTTETFNGKQIGTPLYYNVAAASGYFATNPRGVVFLRSTNLLGASSSEFQVSLTPGGTALDLVVTLTGTFQLANTASLFAGNNTDSTNQVVFNVQQNTAAVFDGANNTGTISTVNSFSNGSDIFQIQNNAGSGTTTGLYVNSMVFYSTTGTAAPGLVNNTTYFVTYVNTITPLAPGLIQIKVSATPGGGTVTITGQGSGTHTIKQIGVSTDKDIFHSRTHGFVVGDMLKYNYPVGGRITTSQGAKEYYFVSNVYDTDNFRISNDKGGFTVLDGSSSDRAALSGFQLAADNVAYSLGLTTRRYWIQTAAMKAASVAPIQMVVDFDNNDNGYGFDFAFVTGGYTGVQVQGNTSFTNIPGLDIVIPRSPQHWRAMLAAVRNFRPSGAESDYFPNTYGIYGNFGGRTYVSQIMRDERFYGSGAPDWDAKDGGRWWLRNNTFSEPNGDYTPGTTLGGYGFPGSMFGGIGNSADYTTQDISFNDGTGGYNFSGSYLISTNAKP
jgi:hypothetical protein